MPGLVMEEMHPQCAAQCPAQNGGKKQRPFRDSPLTLLNPPLVRSHEEERRQICGQQIQSKQAEPFFFHLPHLGAFEMFAIFLIF